MQQSFEEAWEVRAPAKAILCGEHAVVYGQDAIALAIALYCRGWLYTRKIKGSQPAFSIDLDLQPNQTQISSSAMVVFQTLFHDKDWRGHSDSFKQALSDKGILEQQLSDHFASLHFKLGIFLKYYNISWQKWLSSLPCDVKLKIQSAIPLGKGLGSSAAFNSVLAAILLPLFKIIRPQSVGSAQKDKINEISVLFQSVEHGEPSGIDNFVSVNGGLILFNKTNNPKCRQLQRAGKQLRRLFDVGVADSGILKNTKAAVEMVRKRCSNSQEDRQRIKEIGSISHSVLNLLEREGGEINNQFYKLIEHNHLLLRELGLSHPNIEQLIKLGSSKGWSGKLTGSGMGGCILLFSAIDKGQQTGPIKLTQLDQCGLVLKVKKTIDLSPLLLE